jgi:DNA-binding CsgD family transcriptional regulator
MKPSLSAYDYQLTMLHDEHRLVRFAQDHQLTPRELEIMKCMIFNGLSNRDIADMMVISQKTVKNHVSNLYSKCGVSTCRQLIALVLSYVAQSAPNKAEAGMERPPVAAGPRFHQAG